MSAVLLRAAGLAAAVLFFFSCSCTAQTKDSQTPSLAESALRLRANLRNPGHKVRVFTNEDLAGQYSPQMSGAAQDQSQEQPEASSPPSPSPLLLQGYRVPPDVAAEPQQPGPPPGYFVISNHDLDLQYVQPGQQGLYVGIPKLETESPSPQAVESQIQQNIQARLSPPDNPLRPTDSPEVIAAKQQLASALVDLDFAQRLLALDEDAYYSITDFWRSQYDSQRARIEADRQDVAILQQTVARLRARLAELEAQQQGVPPPPQP
ncbi:MAG TPA: hypothetical protein VJP87_06175 [Candidatus Acidoferrales bacterium]|nr:hypothetical protein [Candidatus Acidoferrales bacterium]